MTAASGDVPIRPRSSPGTPSWRSLLTAAGHAPARAARTAHPGGLTAREAEALRLAARGLTTQAIAERLYISPKTAGHHIQHVSTKIGVSTRAAAALWAMQHALVH